MKVPEDSPQVAVGQTRIDPNGMRVVITAAIKHGRFVVYYPRTDGRTAQLSPEVIRAHYPIVTQTDTDLRRI